MSDFSRPTDCSCIPGIKCDVKDCVTTIRPATAPPKALPWHATTLMTPPAIPTARADSIYYSRRAEPCALHGIILHHIAAKNQVRFCNIFSLLM